MTDFESFDEAQDTVNRLCHKDFDIGRLFPEFRFARLKYNKGWWGSVDKPIGTRYIFIMRSEKDFPGTRADSGKRTVLRQGLFINELGLGGYMPMEIFDIENQ